MAGPSGDRPSVGVARQPDSEEDLQAELNPPRDVALGERCPESTRVNVRIRRAVIYPIEQVTRRGLDSYILALTEVRVLINGDVLVVIVEPSDTRDRPGVVPKGVGSGIREGGRIVVHLGEGIRERPRVHGCLAGNDIGELGAAVEQKAAKDVVC